jgi:hypothetical protein
MMDDLLKIKKINRNGMNTIPTVSVSASAPGPISKK